MTNKGFKGERILQREYGTTRRASNFYEKQMLDHLNPAMCEFITKQEEEFLEVTELEKSMAADIMEKGGRRPERWIFITVEEAYIHCSKHVPLLKKLDKKIHWGTDKETYKGGDFFKT